MKCGCWWWTSLRQFQRDGKAKNQNEEKNWFGSYDNQKHENKVWKLKDERICIFPVRVHKLFSDLKCTKNKGPYIQKAAKMAQRTFKHSADDPVVLIQLS